MSPSLRRFLLGSLLFVAVAVGLDRAAGLVLDTLFARVRTGEAAGATNHALEVGGDLWVFGSSRAKQHFDPQVLQAATGLSAYNVAANGQGLPYARGIQAVAQARGLVPRCQVLHLDAVDVFEPRLERVTPLLPYAGETPVVLQLASETDKWARVKSVAATWRYNSITLPLLSNLGQQPPEGFRGFTPKRRSRRGVADAREFLGTEDGPPPEPAAVSEALLRDFVQTARGQGATVVWVTSPMNRPDTLVDGVLRDPLRRAAMDWLRRLADELDVRYLSFDEAAYPEFRDADLFVDAAHLHANGAALLSARLGDALGPGCASPR